MAVRLLVARCEVRYSGRLHALLPEAVAVGAEPYLIVGAMAGG